MDRHKTQLEPALLPESPIRSAASSVRPGLRLLPTDEMRAAKAWLEQLQTPLQPDRELLAIHGWLSPSGQLFACGWEQHNALTKALGFSHESEIEAAGYVKLSQLDWLVQPRYCQRGVTEQQWATIERWYERSGFPEEHLLRLTATL